MASQSAAASTSPSSSVSCVFAGDVGLELQSETGMRIGERGHGRERHEQALALAVKAQCDLEGVIELRDRFPELVLNHDGHVLRMLRAQTIRQHNTRARGLEGDVEVMLPRKVALRFHHAAKHRAGHHADAPSTIRSYWNVVICLAQWRRSMAWKVGSCRALSRAAGQVARADGRRAARPENSGGLLLPGALRTPPDRATGQGLRSDYRHRLRSDGLRSIVVVGNYCVWPDNGGAMPNTACLFTTRVEPVSPPRVGSASGREALRTGGGAGYCPRVHDAYSKQGLASYPANRHRPI